jgi:transposase InsO family protein
VGKLVGRYREGGYEATGPQSRAAQTIPHRTRAEVEDQIVSLRKSLREQGLDAGAETIRYHLALRRGDVPSVSTIWRVLRRRGFVTPQPHQRPRSSFIRFEAKLPNERWQSDVTHWRLADGSEAKIVNFIDDHSRLAIGSRAMRAATAPRVLALFQDAGAHWGFPGSPAHRQRLRLHHLAPGRSQRHADRAACAGGGLPPLPPYHPQTCGKVERFHQTLKRFLAAHPVASSIRELQGQIDLFVAYYNEVRPHRGIGRRTPKAAFEARARARPTGPRISVGAGVRVRRDRIDKVGRVTLLHGGRLHHIWVGLVHKGVRVIMLIDGLDVRIVSENGALLRHLTLDPTRDYQPQE